MKKLYTINNTYKIGVEGYKEHSIKIINNKDSHTPCVDTSIPRRCIGFINNNSIITMNWDKNNIFTITGDFKFFNDKEYELICFEAKENGELDTLVFKEKGENK